METPETEDRIPRCSQVGLMPRFGAFVKGETLQMLMKTLDRGFGEQWVGDLRRARDQPAIHILGLFAPAV